MDANERRERAGAEAAEWWVRLQADGLPRADREQFVDWLRESHLHVAEMLRVAQMHNSLEQFERWTRIATDGSRDETVVPFLPPLPLGERAGVRSSRRWLIAAAVFLFVIAAGFFLPTFRGPSIATDRGERREVALEDGTIVQVDPQTRLRVQFEPHSRRVLLDRGRALFRVAKAVNRPFSVQVDKTVIRALGTSFGVERREHDVVVTVSEGKVAVSSLLPSVELTANRQITVSLTGSPTPVRQVDSSRALAWAEGRLVFENHTVSEVVERFNLYNRVRLTVSDEALARRPVSGVFDASDPESFVAFIETVANVRIRRDGDGNITLAAP